jgi:anti-sigma regulatory factor (Ser/Thr protein kinase)
VTAIRRKVRDFARDRGVDARILDRVALAVSEAATNAVLHAYEEGDRGDVQLVATLGESDLEVAILDEGRGLRDAYESPGIGWGLRLIEQSSTDHELRLRRPKGVELWMRFALQVATLDD